MNHSIDNTPMPPQSDSYFPPGRVGRCPICGYRVVLPCRRCGVLDGTIKNDPALIRDIQPTDELEPTDEPGLQLADEEMVEFLKVRWDPERATKKPAFFVVLS